MSPRRRIRDIVCTVAGVHWFSWGTPRDVPEDIPRTGVSIYIEQIVHVPESGGRLQDVYICRLVPLWVVLCLYTVGWAIRWMVCKVRVAVQSCIQFILEKLSICTTPLYV